MRFQEIHVIPGTAYVQVLPANPNRVNILLSGDGSSGFLVSFQAGTPAAAGIVLTPTDPVQQLLGKYLGDNITGPLYARSATAGAILTIIETFV